MLSESLKAPNWLRQDEGAAFVEEVLSPLADLRRGRMRVFEASLKPGWFVISAGGLEFLPVCREAGGNG